MNKNKYVGKNGKNPKLRCFTGAHVIHFTFPAQTSAGQSTITNLIFCVFTKLT
jgi:hypothetical protein